MIIIINMPSAETGPREMCCLALLGFEFVGETPHHINEWE
jgi:hypothetical protein